jgi:hypothetical protein
MNLGWEIPGTYSAAIQIKNLDITARAHGGDIRP